MSSIDFRQIPQTSTAAQDKRMVAAILEHGDLAKAAAQLDVHVSQIERRYQDTAFRKILLFKIECDLLLHHVPAALKYLLEVVRGDYAGDKERINVAKTLLDRVGLGAARARGMDDGRKGIEDMDMAELQAVARGVTIDGKVNAPGDAESTEQVVDWLA